MPYNALGFEMARDYDSRTSLMLCKTFVNEDYRIHGSGCNEPGRNVILTGHYTF